MLLVVGHVWNTVRKIAISEAAVERAFSHRLVHLQETSLDDILFIRYNFENVLKVEERKAEKKNLEDELLCNPLDSDPD